MRTRVAIAAAIAAAAVVATLVVLTSIALANNDVEQLDRRLDAIVAASVYASPSDNSQQTILTTGRSASNGQVVFQRGFQLPPLPEGTETVTVNLRDNRTGLPASAKETFKVNEDKRP